MARNSQSNASRRPQLDPRYQETKRLTYYLPFQASLEMPASSTALRLKSDTSSGPQVWTSLTHEFSGAAKALIRCQSAAAWTVPGPLVFEEKQPLTPLPHRRIAVFAQQPTVGLRRCQEKLARPMESKLRARPCCCSTAWHVAASPESAVRCHFQISFPRLLLPLTKSAFWESSAIRQPVSQSASQQVSKPASQQVSKSKSASQQVPATAACTRACQAKEKPAPPRPCKRQTGEDQVMRQRTMPPIKSICRQSGATFVLKLASRMTPSAKARLALVLDSPLQSNDSAPRPMQRIRLPRVATAAAMGLMPCKQKLAFSCWAL